MENIRIKSVQILYVLAMSTDGCNSYFTVPEKEASDVKESLSLSSLYITIRAVDSVHFQMWNLSILLDP